MKFNRKIMVPEKWFGLEIVGSVLSALKAKPELYKTIEPKTHPAIGMNITRSIAKLFSKMDNAPCQRLVFSSVVRNWSICLLMLFDSVWLSGVRVPPTVMTMQKIIHRNIVMNLLNLEEYPAQEPEDKVLTPSDPMVSDLFLEF